MFNPANEVSSINFGAIIGGSLNAVVNAQRESADTTVNFVRRVGFMPGEIDAKTGKEKGIGAPICVSFAYDKEVSPSQTQTTRNITVTIKNGGKDYVKNEKIEFSIDDHAIEINDFTLDINGTFTEINLNTIPSGDFIKDGVTITASQLIEPKQEGEKPTNNTSAELKLSIKETETPIPALYQKMQIDVPILTMMPIPFIKIDNADIEFNVKINSVSNSKNIEESNRNITSNTTAGYKGWGANVGTSLNASFSNQKSTSNSEEVKKDYSLNIKVHAVQDDMPAGMSKILDILEESIVTKTISEPSKTPDEKDK